MRIAGLLLLIAGCVVVIAGLNMDTTVEVWNVEFGELPHRVHNLDLAARQDHIIMIGCFVALAGVILIGLAECAVPPRDLVGRLTTQTTLTKPSGLAQRRPLKPSAPPNRERREGTSP
jgi:hypothetical protein